MATKEKIEGLNIWLPQEEKESLKGTIVKIDTDTQYGIQAQIKNEDGNVILTPSHKWLQNCLRRLVVGDTIEIVYEGDEPPKVKGQSPTKKYSVYRINA
jgi:hypothetical protein